MVHTNQRLHQRLVPRCWGLERYVETRQRKTWLATDTNNSSLPMRVSPTGGNTHQKRGSYRRPNTKHQPPRFSCKKRPPPGNPMGQSPTRAALRLPPPPAYCIGRLLRRTVIPLHVKRFVGGSKMASSRITGVLAAPRMHERNAPSNSAPSLMASKLLVPQTSLGPRQQETMGALAR